MLLSERCVTAQAPSIDGVERLPSSPGFETGERSKKADNQPLSRRYLGLMKDALEHVVDMPLRWVCYPGGEYRHQHRAMVCEAGFELARTVRRGVTGLSPHYETHTTVNAYRLRSIQDGSRVLHTVLRDHHFGLSGRLVQSVGKCVHADDRKWSTA
jgi:hypothetical protein